MFIKHKTDGTIHKVLGVSREVQSPAARLDWSVVDTWFLIWENERWTWVTGANYRLWYEEPSAPF